MDGCVFICLSVYLEDDCLFNYSQVLGKMKEGGESLDTEIH